MARLCLLMLCNLMTSIAPVGRRMNHEIMFRISMMGKGCKYDGEGVLDLSAYNFDVKAGL